MQINFKKGGTGTPRIGMYEPHLAPPFIGTWEQMRGNGKKTTTTRASKRGKVCY